MDNGKPTFEQKQQQFALIFAELNRQLSDQARRTSAAESRAGVLIGSAAIVTGLLSSSPTPLLTLSMALCVAAVGFGVTALLPRQIDTLGGLYTRDEILQRDDFDASMYMSRQYVGMIDKQERHVTFRLTMVKMGFLVFGASLLIAFAAIASGR